MLLEKASHQSFLPAKSVGPFRRECPPIRMAQSQKKIAQLQVLQAAQFIRREAGLAQSTRVDFGIILGSGLGEVTRSVISGQTIPFHAIPEFPDSSVAGHSGLVVLGKMGGASVCCLQGRLHYYEGHSMQTVTFPVRVMEALGVRRLIVTNAAGGLSRRFRAGDLMIIRDHIGLFLPNPLRGPNLTAAGPRFPELSQAYPERLREIAAQCARDLGLRIREGVYVAVPGPSYETPAEIEMLRRMGADAVGMSTVPEVVVARHLGIECLGISVITNLAAGLAKTPLAHQEVLRVGAGIQKSLRLLVTSICEALSSSHPMARD